MPIRVRVDDLAAADVQALVAEHLADMHAHSPPGAVHALPLDHLRTPDITFVSARRDGVLCGCGALKALDATSGEIKSMRTRAGFLRLGVAQAVLHELMRLARERRYTRLFLETGTGPAFEAAHALYRKNGFSRSDAFGDYTPTTFSTFMVKVLHDRAEPHGASRASSSAARR